MQHQSDSDFENQQASLPQTLLERTELKVAIAAQNLRERAGLTFMAAKRGRMLAAEARPILKAMTEIRVNIAHAHGISRANGVLTQLYDRLEGLKAQQERLVAQNHAMTADNITIPTGLASGERSTATDESGRANGTAEHAHRGNGQGQTAGTGQSVL